jgi:hypothetical protein
LRRVVLATEGQEVVRGCFPIPTVWRI